MRVDPLTRGSSPSVSRSATKRSSWPRGLPSRKERRFPLASAPPIYFEEVTNMFRSRILVESESLGAIGFDFKRDHTVPIALKKFKI